MPETAFDSIADHCQTLIKQKEILYDGLNRILEKLDTKEKLTRQELREIAFWTLKNSSMIA